MEFIEEFLEEKDKKFRGGLLIDSANIKDLLARGAVDVFDINWMLADAKDHVREAKKNLDRKEVFTVKKVLEEHAYKQTQNANLKKLTSEELKRKVKIKSSYANAIDKLNEAEKVYDFLKVKYDAIRERNDLAKELAKYKSNEMYAGIASRIKERKDDI
jgi:hypothetical protein